LTAISEAFSLSIMAAASFRANMIRMILSIAVLTSFMAANPLKADPPSNRKKEKTKTSKTLPKLVPATPLKEGWSLVNGIWSHSDGYQFVNGQVIRVGTQTHKKPPKPPTKAEMAAARKTTRPQTSADTAAARAAERERNLRQIPASQTGTHL
jgi:hypothetical protein